MRKIFITSQDPKQVYSVPLDDGTAFKLQIAYYPRIMAWIIVELTYNGFTLYGNKIVNSKNLLHQFRNLIPFGILCKSVNDRDPMLIEDFESGNTELYLLSSAETLAYWESLSGN